MLSFAAARSIHAATSTNLISRYVLFSIRIATQTKLLQNIAIRAHYRHLGQSHANIVHIETMSYQFETTVMYPNLDEVFLTDAPIRSKVVEVTVGVHFRVFYVTTGYIIREAVVMRCPDPRQPDMIRGVRGNDRKLANRAIIL